MAVKLSWFLISNLRRFIIITKIIILEVINFILDRIRELQNMFYSFHHKLH